MQIAGTLRYPAENERRGLGTKKIAQICCLFQGSRTVLEQVNVMWLVNVTIYLN